MVKATLGSFDYLRYLGRRLRKWRQGPAFHPVEPFAVRLTIAGKF
jgi:hypothetical protein